MVRSIVAVMLVASLTGGDDHAHAQQDRSSALASANSSRIDATTRWAFQTAASVTVSSPIVRLGDVIQPIDSGLAAWQRLSQSPIGLVPVGGQTMTIDRDRLTTIILNAEATPHSIDWLGPRTIRVNYQANAVASGEQLGNAANPLQQAAYQTPAYRTHAGQNQIASSQDGKVDTEVPLTASELRQVLHWIDLAVKRFHPEVDQTYEVKVPSDQSALASLRHIVRVTSLSPITDIAEGNCRFYIEARKLAGPVSAEVTINLTAHPMVVVANRTLGRGAVIGRSDLELKPLHADKLPSDVATDFASLVGMEARASLRSGQPIARSDVGSPILIHRGDLIEIRVLGGGVSVSTNAKALGNGAKGELIELETTNPRKRLVARVAGVAVAEILTRAPVVR